MKINPNSLKALEEHRQATQFKKGEKKSKEDIEKMKAAKKRKSDLKELLEIYLALPDEETGELNDIAITLAQIKEAKKGNTKAYEVIRDTIGQKPVEKQEISTGSDLTIQVVKG